MPSQAYLAGKEGTYDGVGTTDKTISKPESGQDNQISPIPCRRVFHVSDNINHRVLSLDAFLQPGLPRAKNGLVFILDYALFILHTGSRDAGNTDQLSHAAKTAQFARLTTSFPGVHTPVLVCGPGNEVRVNKTGVAIKR